MLDWDEKKDHITVNGVTRCYCSDKSYDETSGDVNVIEISIMNW